MSGIKTMSVDAVLEKADDYLEAHSVEYHDLDKSGGWKTASGYVTEETWAEAFRGLPDWAEDAYIVYFNNADEMDELQELVDNGVFDVITEFKENADLENVFYMEPMD